MTDKEIIKTQKRYINALKQNKSRNKPYIVSGNITYTINDLIFEIKNLTSFGLNQIKSLYKLDKEMAVKQRRKKIKNILNNKNIKNE